MLDLSKFEVVTKEDFLNDLVETYSDTDKRSVIDRQGFIICMYRSGNNKCAIGQYISDEDYSEDLEYTLVDDPKIWDLLPEKIQALEVGFLKDMQSFHDQEEYWDSKEKSLSGLGRIRIRDLVNVWGLDTNKLTFFL